MQGVSTYEEAKQLQLTREQARTELLEHHQDESDWQEFVEDHGDLSHYSGKQVLDFLGY